MNLNTKTKIAIASSMSKIVRFMRSLFSLRNEEVFCRNKIYWHLDLSQGIDFAIFLQGGFEPSTIRSYKKYVNQGDVVLDIGANIGAHTLPLASLVGRTGKVIAFEPTDYAYEKLIKNLELNPELLSRTIPIQAMLVGNLEEAKPTFIPSSWSLDAASGLDIHPVHGGTNQSLKGASLVKLDDWFQHQNLKQLDFIKIDVDG
jgi:FkbM family methyltransferase